MWATPNTIRKSWCPYCAGKIVTLDDVQRIAKERGGECLSTMYAYDNIKLVWRCRYNHTWYAIPGAIKRGSWCPECSAGLGERLCRAFFESLFGDSFLRAYPEWLKLGHRIKLQLDGYNQKTSARFRASRSVSLSSRWTLLKGSRVTQEMARTGSQKRRTLLEAWYHLNRGS